MARDGRGQSAGRGDEREGVAQLGRSILQPELACPVCAEFAANQNGSLSFVSGCGRAGCADCWNKLEGSGPPCARCRKRRDELAVLPRCVRSQPTLKLPGEICKDCKAEFLGKAHPQVCPERKAVHRGYAMTASELLETVAKVDTPAPACENFIWRCKSPDKAQSAWEFRYQGARYRVLLERFLAFLYVSCLTIGGESIRLILRRSDEEDVPLHSRRLVTVAGSFQFTNRAAVIHEQGRGFSLILETPVCCSSPPQDPGEPTNPPQDSGEPTGVYEPF